MNAKQEKSWIDFQSIKAEADIPRVLGHLGLLERLTPKGDEFIGWCPLGAEHGTDDSFAFNAAKKTFHCIACKRRGSILDLVSQMEKMSIKDAANLVVALTSPADEKEHVRRERQKRPAEHDTSVNEYRRTEGRETIQDLRRELAKRSDAKKRRVEELCDSLVNGAEGRCNWVMSWSQARRVVGSKIGAHEVVVIHIGELMTQFLAEAYDGGVPLLENKDERHSLSS